MGFETGAPKVIGNANNEGILGLIKPRGQVAQNQGSGEVPKEIQLGAAEELARRKKAKAR